jgi:hypothetical protein
MLVMFIDGSHKFHYITEDIAWIRLLEPIGIVSYQDYTRNFLGVVHLVGRFPARNGNCRVIEQVETLLIVEKTAASTAQLIGAWE